MTKSSDAKMMMQQTELLETDATVCEIDAHFRHKYLTQKTIRRQQKYTRKLPKIKIDAQIFNFETQKFLMIKK